MSDPTPYIHLPGTAREALTFYAEVFGCGVEMFTLQDFNRTDGPADAIAHGYLTGGPVALFAADAVGEPAFRSEGLMLALLGTADPSTLKRWFARQLSSRRTYIHWLLRVRRSYMASASAYMPLNVDVGRPALRHRVAPAGR